MFVTCTTKKELGLGKLIAHTSTEATIEYFDSPALREQPTFTVPISTVKAEELSPEMRVYHCQPESGLWQVGRVLVQVEDFAIVRFPNHEDRKLPLADIHLRWRKPITDPTTHLASYMNETPFFAGLRSRFVRVIVDQRAASEGMSGLLSSTIALESHQLRVIRRVMQDPIQRYLLADEVGLGKTIEAGVLIRQYILDEPKSHHIVVVVPRPLLGQWVTELTRKFHLEFYIDDGLYVIPYDDPEQLDEHLPQATMLVMDEAHIVSSFYTSQDPRAQALYKDICLAANRVRRLLLLSATPVTREDTGFLSMLHLLDPAIYPLTGHEEFRRRLEQRQSIAELVAMFRPDNFFFLDECVDALETMFPDDKVLLEMTTALRPILETSVDASDPASLGLIQSIRTHLSESYRLHRRILRNRRRTVEGLTPGRAGASPVDYIDGSARAAFEWLEEWRGEVASSLHRNMDEEAAIVLGGLYRSLLESLASDPAEFLELASKRLAQGRVRHKRPASGRGGPGSGAERFLDGEERCLAKMVTAAEGLVDSDVRARAALSAIKAALQRNDSVIVFCTSAASADQLLELLRAHLTVSVVRHKAAESLEDGWEGLVTDGSPWVLVCDRSAEEGLNLQGQRRSIVHYDLPLAPNRVEQRMGRVDRYGSGHPVESHVIRCRDNPAEVEWFECLRTGLGVFDRSIAALQYFAQAQMTTLSGVFLSSGISAMSEFTERLCGENGETAREFRRLDAYDALESLQEDEVDASTALEDLDEQWETIERSVDAWTQQALRFQKVAWHVSAPSPPDRVFRFQYNKMADGPTLIPLPTFLDHFLESLDLTVPKSKQRPMTHVYSYRRQTALAKGLRVLRYGDAFMNELAVFTQCDDRGRIFALWRYWPGHPLTTSANAHFCVTFIVEVGIGVAMKSAATHAGGGTPPGEEPIRRRADMLFPPMLETVWLDEYLEPVVNEVTLATLEAGYTKEAGPGGRRDYHMNPARWEKLIKHGLPCLENWAELCAAARQRAEAVLHQKASLQERTTACVALARAIHERQYTQLRARIARLPDRESAIEQERLDAESHLNISLYAGILDPEVRVDSIGVVFLSGVRLEPPEGHKA